MYNDHAHLNSFTFIGRRHIQTHTQKKKDPIGVYSTLAAKGIVELGVRGLSGYLTEFVRLGPRLHVWDPWELGWWIANPGSLLVEGQPRLQA